MSRLMTILVPKHTSGMHIGLFIFTSCLYPARQPLVIQLATNGVLTCHQVTVIPKTATVIRIIEQLAKADGMNRLALQGKDGKLFYDSTWIAGVDYTDDFYDNMLIT